jgi:hypothetical protein
MMQQAWTTTDIEALEAIELPTREAFTGLCGGLISVDLDVCIDLDVKANVDVDLGSDCGSSSGGEDKCD